MEKRLQIAKSKLDSLNKATQKEGSSDLIYNKTNALLNLSGSTFDSLTSKVKVIKTFPKEGPTK